MKFEAGLLTTTLRCSARVAVVLL